MSVDEIPCAGLAEKIGSVSVNEVSGVIVLLPSVIVPLEIFASVIPCPLIVDGFEPISENA
jgi:hypothetical protein